MVRSKVLLKLGLARDFSLIIDARFSKFTYRLPEIVFNVILYYAFGILHEHYIVPTRPILSMLTPVPCRRREITNG